MSNGLYIYNNGNYIEEINKPCTTIDLLPTLADLFDLDYDNRTVLGHDIFSYRYGGFIFDDSMDDDTTWVISNYDFNYFYTSFIEDSRRYYIDLMDVNHKILKYDYFKYVK